MPLYSPCMPDLLLERGALILSEYVIPGMLVRDHLVEAPLDWERPDDGRTIELFAREVVDPTRRHEDLPRLLFLQGGPGGKSPRPSGGPPWLKEALKSYRVILLDQRGTGRSSRIDATFMARFADGAAAAGHLGHFRADSIVRDAEHLRTTVFGGGRWETLGQSYGGFLTMTYLSLAPEGLAACYVTGGLPGLTTGPEEVYRRTFPRARAKSERFYRRYPADRALVAKVADLIEADDIRLPDGDRLSVRRLQIVGIDFGTGPGFENVHWLFDEAFADHRQERLSDHFLAAMQHLTSYDGNPLYAVLQEDIYGQGEGATAWAAWRVLADHPELRPTRRPLLFPGEMIYPWMFEEIRSLRPFRAAAEALHARPRHGRLYDPERLAANEVPVAAIVYHDDLFVDAGLSLETAARVGNVQTWVTNEFEHDGVRQSPAVFTRLRAMVRETGGPVG